MTLASLATPPIALPRRRAELDIARALGIVLVVAGHAIIGVERALGDGPAVRVALTLIYAVHMPFFFALSGLLAGRALAEPAPAFARRLISRFALPYLVWSLVLLGFHAAFGDYTNTRVTAPNPLRILWAPPSVMWFLYVLAAAFVLARVTTRPADRRLLGAALVLVGPWLDTWLFGYLRFVGIFLVATTVELDAVRAAARHPAARALAALAFATGVFAALAAAHAPLAGYPAAALRDLPAGLGGSLLVLAAGAALAAQGGAVAEGAAAVGRRTLPIYLAHVLVLAALRIVLIRLGLRDPALLLLVLIPAGVALPLVAAHLAERLGVARALGWS